MIVGLDTGSDRFHALELEGTQWKAVRSSIEIATKNPKKRGSDDERRQRLYEEASAYFFTLPAGTSIFCEESLALTNGKTSRILGMAVGAIWCAHLSYDLYWHWANVSTWKKEVVGNGNAKKLAVIEWVRTESDLEPKPDWAFNAKGEGPESDWHDAACLALYGRKWIEGVVTSA